MSISTRPSATDHPLFTSRCSAKDLGPPQRQKLAVQALAKAVPISHLAEEHHVSRKFVYHQQAIAQQVLATAFESTPEVDDKVLFYLPVTKAWLKQFVLGLVLIAHCSLRGVVELCRDLLNYDISLGTVHNIVRQTVAAASTINEQQDLSSVRVGAHDEIFQNGQPVLVGVDAQSSYCYLLSSEDHRDGDTWGIRILELQDRGFDPDAVVADAGTGLRAGLAAALPEVPCRSDVFHALQEVRKVISLLENRAYRAIEACDLLRRKIARSGQKIDPSLLDQLTHAVPKEARAVELADQIALLADWLRHDVLSLAGPPHAERLALFDFIRAELHNRISEAPDHLRKLVRYLKGQRDDLLAFAAQLDIEFAALAEPLDLDPAVVRKLFAAIALPLECPHRWHLETPLRRILGEYFFPLAQALETLRRGTVRASSVVENLNSRLRGYFFLRRHVGNDYLALLQFFLNHRRFPRSDRPERVGKSPAEAMTGQEHPHWLELLGYSRFSRN